MALLIDPEESVQSATQVPPIFASGLERRKQVEIFKLRLHEEILRSQRRKYPFALVRVHADSPASMDIEDALRSCIRDYDFICMWKPNEYLLGFPETGIQSAENIANRLREAVSRASWNDERSATEVTIGIACFPQDGTNAEDLLKSACS